jgi:multicomponent Na+:H+ antiporter subunit B
MRLAPLCFTLLLIAMFIGFMPGNAANTFLKDRYLALFQNEIGGDNAVTAIYMGYRMYDTLFEALMLLVGIMAVVHLSWHREMLAPHSKPSEVRNSEIAITMISLIGPLLLLFSIYLAMNGHLSPGGGFQGGVVVALFFVCRYMVHDIHDIRINKVITLEKFVYAGIVLIAVFFVFLGANAFLPIPKTIYLVMMNLLIGLKIACGFLVVFYRFIALEWR